MGGNLKTSTGSSEKEWMLHFFAKTHEMKLIFSSCPLFFSLLDFQTGGQVKLLAGIIANYTPYLA